MKVISSSCEIKGIVAGGNMRAASLSNVEISFTLDKEDPRRNIDLTFSVGSEGAVLAPTQSLPILYINIFNEDGSYDNELLDINLSHKNPFTAEYWLVNGENCDFEGIENIGSEDNPELLEIKARGNFTRTAFAKKPFKLKLANKQSLAGLSRSKHFVLLAHADDTYGFLRNFTGFNLGNRIGLPWTPHQVPVELVVNGDYRGLYFLTESIKIEKDRIDIETLMDNCQDASLVSGGYLVELDNYDDTNQIRMSEKWCAPGHNYDALRITQDTPEEYSPLMTRFVSEQFEAMNNAVGSVSNELWQYLDLDDAARYYLVEEIVSHTESYHGSTYLFRDRGEGKKWHFSPLWDFGNAFSGPTDDYFFNHDPYGNTWIPSIMLNDDFREKVKLTWIWFMQSRYEGLRDDIERYVASIAEGARRDNERWKNSSVPNGGQPIADNSDIERKKNDVIRHLNSKINWMKNVFGDYEKMDRADEPARDDTLAAPLPEYILSSKEELKSEECAIEYFTLQGKRVSHPESGNIYIVRKGSRVNKILIR
ncbi:MAG: hypothetical protein HDS74_07550 [Bacteroidales bacterium]|nr:hypothetical protein [Bacteroidales bacterium]